MPEGTLKARARLTGKTLLIPRNLHTANGILKDAGLNEKF
jgi:hypothetical protein